MIDYKKYAMENWREKLQKDWAKKPLELSEVELIITQLMKQVSDQLETIENILKGL